MPEGMGSRLVLRNFCARQKRTCALGRQAGFVHFWRILSTKMLQNAPKITKVLSKTRYLVMLTF